MLRSWPPLGKSVRLLLAVLFLVGGGVSDAGVGPAPRKEPFRIRVPNRAGIAVRRALLSVKRRLADEQCRLVLSDFSSTALGLSLSDVLDSRSRSVEEHVDSLVFKDGSGKPACVSPGTLAFTHVGSDTIYVCGSQFTRAIEADPAFAEMILIHELLHTLGLGENPPSSGEITARVTDRCGDWRVRRASAERLSNP